MAEMKSLNGNTFVDQSARNEIEALKKNGVGGGGGDVTTGAMQAAIAAAIQEHNEEMQPHPIRIDPIAKELIAIKQTVSELTAEKVGADPAGTAATKVSEHDTYTGSHNDIRLLIKALQEQVNKFLDVDDTTRDELSEVLAMIDANAGTLESLTSSKVNVTDIINNLTSNVTNKPLSAAQGVALKNLIDALGNSKLDASALGAAVNQALLIAKESGEFKGEKGDKGDTGAQGIQGVQGIQGAKGDKGEKGDPYTLTEDDKALIVAQVIQSLGGNPIFGYVDDDNNIIVQGTLADGTYSVKYEMDNGSTVDIGNLVLDTNVYYSVTKNLTNCTVSNSATQVAAGGSYSATVTANSGYTLDSVTATMGGSAVSVSSGVINIASVTGDIVITATASETVVEPAYKNLCVENGDGWITDGRCSGTGEDRTGSVGNIVTNYIPVKVGDVVRVQGLEVARGGSLYSGIYKADKTAIKGFYMTTDYSDCVTNIDRVDGAYACSFTIANAEAGYIRLCGQRKSDATEIIITVNQEIK